ncbi:hypothetical protein FGE12_10460 [Aggregicoccus sp. 17bor-14]|uniref:hypothetical protein n=1 Tax=Myxococcaceae TaxID=31 RepID=UPI00129C6A2F|nr:MULTISPECIES: hypothetical protein [Myxococcaceae]MBF5042815.1 hypothetical protein [Simulacricoccus sp. 17bor-14]MRI88583.1 hypothetical protein [Aggregicoccus sp. 17bor-14]
MRPNLAPAVRGSALLLTLVALAVLGVLVVGAIQFTGTNRMAAVSKMRGDRVSACAETARRYLLAKLRLYNLDPTSLRLEQTLMDDAVASRRSVMTTTHYGDPNGQATVVAVSASSVSSSRGQARDLANRLVPPTMGGAYYRVVVMCKEEGRSSELEFLFRYGL